MNCIKNWSPKKLIAFENKIANLYKHKKIRFPIHLSGTNEEDLIKIFKKYKKGDWIFSTWRSHYHWLLSGRSPQKLLKQIMQNGSMHIFDDKFFTSAIVGGISPIALGVAWALKRKKSNNKVWCFVGDMSASGGLFHECEKYSRGHDLPIKFVIEDNGLSVETDTKKVWGTNNYLKNKISRYYYNRKWPHAGTGKFILF